MLKLAWKYRNQGAERIIRMPLKPQRYAAKTAQDTSLEDVAVSGGFKLIPHSPHGLNQGRVAWCLSQFFYEFGQHAHLQHADHPRNRSPKPSELAQNAATPDRDGSPENAGRSNSRAVSGTSSSCNITSRRTGSMARLLKVRHCCSAAVTERWRFNMAPDPHF